MPGKGPKNFPCLLCRKRTKQHERRKITKSERRYLEKNFFVTVNNEDTLCNKCRHKYYACTPGKEEQANQKQQNNTPDNKDDSDYFPTPKRPKSRAIASPPSVTLAIPSTFKSHSSCFLCKRRGPKLVVVSSKARYDVFMKHEIIIPAGSRCCPNHLYEDNFVSDLTIVDTKENTSVNRTTILDLLKRLRSAALQSKTSRINFDCSSTLTESDYLNLTGVCKNTFDDLHSYIEEKVRNTPARSSRTSLGIFLFKLKSGISNNVLSTILNISKSSLRREKQKLSLSKTIV
ncbi:uncharacterized protein LOC134275791 [Saccostrea cucullata]|uniref:uncharacterized protein LOC134275791 n=1 Tax=Saccostrea cuccullata TaxID=36930 RepID=UPI002ED2CF4E